MIGWYGGIVLSIFMIGWALGGLIFGPIADRYGRAKTMAITILIYATFTGLCGIANSWQELAVFRFLTGIGIGGEWAAGAALIAESWPAKSRAKAAGIMQASGGIGFFLAIGFISSSALTAGAGFSPSASCRPSSRFTFVTRWKNRSAGPRPNRPAIPTLLYSSPGAPRRAGRHRPRGGRHLRLSGRHSMGAELDRRHAARPGHQGGHPSGKLDHHDADHRRHHRLSVHAVDRRSLGQKSALWIYFLGALLSVPTTFLFAKEFSHAVMASPVMGFFAAGVTTGFAIYFPELFPTNIRATAQGFCFNFARFFSAAGPLLAGMLTSAHGSFAPAIATIGSIYFVGLIILIGRAKPRAKRCRTDSICQQHTPMPLAQWLRAQTRRRIEIPELKNL